MRKVCILGLIALAALIIGLAFADQMTFTTYYPAPYGVYNNMRVMNSLGVGTTEPFTKLHLVSDTTGSTDPDYNNPWLGGKHIELEATAMWRLINSYGTLFTWNTDSLFIGLKDEGWDRKDAIIAWGDNPVGTISSGGPDCLRFVFVPSEGPFGLDPLEIMRLTPAGNVGIGTTTVPNILTVMQGSATDPIADSWGTYPCDREHKEIIRTINPHGFLERIIAQPLYEWKRKAEDLDKAKLPKFASTRVGMMVDDKETPKEILLFDTEGKVEGIDLLAYIGYLHATIKEAALEIQNLKVEVEKLKGDL